MIIEETFNSEADRISGSLDQGCGKESVLILGNLRVHHSKLIKERLEKNEDKIKVFHLPCYNPKFNPGERLIADLKHEIFAKYRLARMRN